MNRPDVFDYLDHRNFLKDWIQFLKVSKKVSLRTLAGKSGVSASSLSFCLTEERNWTLPLLGRIFPHLNLKKTEIEALRLLFVIGTTDDPIERLSSFDELRKIPAYSEKQRDSSTMYLYLRHWLNVAIRELVQLPQFKAEAKWIRAHLRFMPTEIEVERSLKFLIKENYIVVDNNGNWTANHRDLDCQEGVFRLSLSEYHRQVLQLTQRSIEEIPRELRLILGHTSALDANQRIKAEEILKAALSEIQKLNNQDTKPEQIYQFEFIMIPLSQKGDAA